MQSMQGRSSRPICNKQQTQKLQDRRLVKKSVKIVCISKRLTQMDTTEVLSELFISFV